MIPRRIIQTARSRDLSPLARASAANLRLLHPDWEHVFFDDADVERFIATEFPKHRSMYESFPHRIQRFDFFRYLAVLRLGGFYFDLDVLLGESLHPLLGASCVFPFEELTLNTYLRTRCGMDAEIGNYGFGATAGHPFLQQIVDNCVRAQTDARWAAPLLEGVPAVLRGEFHVLNTTGPGLVTRTYAEAVPPFSDVTILSTGDVCDERNWHQFGRYGVHLMAASWRSRKHILWRRVMRYCENRARRLRLAESRALGPTRSFLVSPA